MRPKSSERVIILQRLIFVVSAVLVLKVASLQLFGTQYSQQAEARLLDKQTLYPSRGLVYDRQGQLLVYNNPIYDVEVVYNHLNEHLDTHRICDLLQLTRAEFEERLDKPWGERYSKAVPFTFEKHVAPATFARFQESMHEFSGFDQVLRNVRGYNYPYAGHVLGYISEVDQEAIDGVRYFAGDYTGTTGIENIYEPDLRGEKGAAYVLKDNLGRQVANVESGRLDSSAVSGIDIQLSIDIDLQGYGEQLMQGKTGSVVCIEPSSGEILAMLSAPGFDPEQLTIQKGRSDAFAKLQQDSLQPFFDRSIMASYPPGSIIKPVLALIAMQEGILRPSRDVYCDGAYHYGSRSFGCHAHEHPANIAVALQHSCNTYFFQIFRELIEKDGFREADSGLQNLNRYFATFGLGGRLGVDLPQETTGNLPLPQYYDDLYGHGVWRSTYIISLGIGQGEMELTTLQMANLAAIIANRGYYYTPHIIKRYINGVRELPHEFSIKRTVPIAREHYRYVVAGMADAVARGTAVKAYHPDIQICGKTGTSENPHGADHSVFYAFAPMDDPKIAIAVYIENAGWGGTYAAPIASLMIEKYLNGQIHRSRKWTEQRMMEAQLNSQQ